MSSQISTGTRIIAQIGLVVVLLALGSAVAMMMVATAEKPRPKHPADNSPIVRTLIVSESNGAQRIELNGVVSASERTQIIAQVAGRVESVADGFIDGGFVAERHVAQYVLPSIRREGERVADVNSGLSRSGNKTPLLTLDDSDAQLALSTARNGLTQAYANVEQARAARKQAEASTTQARANVEVAKAQLAQAEAAVGPARSRIKTAEAGVESANAALIREEAEAAIALREWNEYGKEGEPSPLVAREPQLRQARANLASAEAQVAAAHDDVEAAQASVVASQKNVAAMVEAVNVAQEQVSVAQAQVEVALAAVDSAVTALQQAQLMLDRTQIYAPYVGRVVQVHVRRGQYVSPGTTLATIYPTEFVEITLPVPNADAGAIDLPWHEPRNVESADADVTIRANIQGQEIMTTGFMHRVLSEINTDSGVIPTVVRVRKPLELELPLLPGQFVSATIEGKQEGKVIELPRSAIRDTAPREVEAELADEELPPGTSSAWVLVMQGVDEVDLANLYDLNDEDDEDEITKFMEELEAWEAKKEEGPENDGDSPVLKPKNDDNSRYARLMYKRVYVTRYGRDVVYIDLDKQTLDSPLTNGDRLCVSSLSVAANGKLVRFEGVVASTSNETTEE